MMTKRCRLCGGLHYSIVDCTKLAVLFGVGIVVLVLGSIYLMVIK